MFRLHFKNEARCQEFAAHDYKQWKIGHKLIIKEALIQDSEIKDIAKDVNSQLSGGSVDEINKHKNYEFMTNYSL